MAAVNVIASLLRPLRGPLLVVFHCIAAPALVGQAGADGTQSANATAASDTALVQAKRYSEAMDRFEAALATSPGNLEARRGETAAAIGWAAEEAQQQHPEKSMTILERAIQHLPDEPELLVSFGLEAITLGQLPIAEQALRAADKLRPGDLNTTYALARLEIEEGHLPDAERDLKAYLAVRTQDASAYFGLGHVYAMEQRDADARAAFEQSIKLQPKQTESYYQIGQLDLEAHRDEEARAMFARVLTRNAHHAGALTGTGELELRVKHYAEAERLLAQAEQSDPTYRPPHYFRGLALAKLGRKDEAEQELQRGDSRPHATGPAEAEGSAGAREAVGSSPPH